MEKGIASRDRHVGELVDQQEIEVNWGLPPWNSQPKVSQRSFRLNMRSLVSMVISEILRYHAPSERCWRSASVKGSPDALRSLRAGTRGTQAALWLGPSGFGPMGLTKRWARESLCPPREADGVHEELERVDLLGERVHVELVLLVDLEDRLRLRQELVRHALVDELVAETDSP